jgi:hypothetical protein
MSFHINTIKMHENQDGSATYKYQIYKKNKTPMTAKELKAISAKLLEKVPKGSDLMIKGHDDTLPANAPVMIQGLNPERWRTIKAYGKDINIMDEEDYYDGKVQDESKFKKYYQAVVTLTRKPN